MPNYITENKRIKKKNKRSADLKCLSITPRIRQYKITTRAVKLSRL